MRTQLTTYLIASSAVALTLFGACKDDTTTNPPVAGDKVHGEYLVKNVAGCGDCHTPRDMTGTPIDSLTMAGGTEFPLQGLGSVYSRNLTPDTTYGIGTMTDDEVIAAIRGGLLPARMHGMANADTVLFPVMPYWLYANLTDADARDIVAYLRSVKAVHYQPKADSIPAQARVRWSRQAGIPDGSPNNGQTQLGKYLVTLAGCIDCHTVPAATVSNPFAQGVNMSLFLAGGRPFPAPADPGKFVVSKNITPDNATGIGTWTTAQIDSAFAYGWDDEHRALCPPMPWMVFHGMTQTDQNAIIAYLRGIPAINNSVPEDTTIHCPHP